LTLKDLPLNQQQLISELAETTAFLALARKLREDIEIQPMRKVDIKTRSLDSIALEFARQSGYVDGVTQLLDLLEGNTADGGRRDSDGPAREPAGL
jgi:hypothetical protein